MKSLKSNINFNDESTLCETVASKNLATGLNKTIITFIGCLGFVVVTYRNVHQMLKHIVFNQKNAAKNRKWMATAVIKTLFSLLSLLKDKKDKTDIVKTPAKSLMAWRFNLKFNDFGLDYITFPTLL